MARAGRRAAAEKGNTTLNQMQQLQLQFNSGGELRPFIQPKILEFLNVLIVGKFSTFKFSWLVNILGMNTGEEVF